MLLNAAFVRWAFNALYISVSALQRVGVLPIMTYMGRLHPEGVPFQVFRYERVGNLLVEVYERVGKSVILICKKG